ncbi:MAG: hypothetical protein JWM34_5015 [Ilumatobacteraceae bacterium]|nr:hypothetical protein [Ilumatobacteraceae bacterium]
MALLLALVVIALIVGVGGLIKGLLWLTAVGIIFLIVGVAFGVSRLRSS